MNIPIENTYYSYTDIHTVCYNYFIYIITRLLLKLLINLITNFLYARTYDLAAKKVHSKEYR